MLLTGEPTGEQHSLREELTELMLRYQQSDTDAASLLITRLSPPVFHFFLRQVRDRSGAEDLLQDFWLRLHKARHTYRMGEPVLPWAFAIARHVQVDGYRRRSRITEHELQSDQLPPTSSGSPGLHALPPISDMLKDLPAAQRETLVLLKVVGLSLEEVARATGTTVGAVKQKARRAYVALRKRFGHDT